MTLAKPPRSATVKLTSFCLYRLHGKIGSSASKVEVVAGAADARISDDGKVQLLLASSPFHSESFSARTPQNGDGLLALYGHRDALEELQYWREQARILKAEFAYMDYEVWVSEISAQLVSRETLKATGDLYRFLNLRRMQSDFQKEVLAKFQGYVKKEGGDVEKEMGRVSQIALRPDLFGKLLSDDEDFQHIRVMVAPIADDPDIPGRMRQVAYVRPEVAILNTVQGGSSYEIVFPSWMNVRNTVEPLVDDAKTKANSK